MTLPFPLPDWLPWWLALAVLLPALLYLLIFLLMPFGVLGLKGRLDQIDERLDEIQAELRRIGTVPPEPVGYPGEPPPGHGRSPRPGALLPPIPPMRPPPPPGWVEFELQERDAPPPRPEAGPPRRRPPVTAPRRLEPRLDWPRA